MAQKIFLFIITLFLFSYSAFPQKMGLGIIIGEPTGINFITHLDANRYLSIAVGWSPDALNSHFDLNIKYSLKEEGLYWYWGAGALFKSVKKTEPFEKSKQEFNMGLRIPFGLEYILQDIKLSFFAELVPGLNLIPASDFLFAGAIGIRYYFK